MGLSSGSKEGRVRVNARDGRGVGETEWERKGPRKGWGINRTTNLQGVPQPAAEGGRM